MAADRLHVVADISAHGLGHLTQIAPVLQTLHERLGERLALTVRTAHAPRRVAAVLGIPFETAPPPPDPGFVMKGPAVVDVRATREAYAALHRDLSGTIERETKRLARLSPDLLISDVGYVGLAAAAKLGVPAVALCSLHWAEMMTAYLLPGDANAQAGPDSEVRRWIEEALAAYDGAAAFLLAAPRRRVPGLTNVRRIAPVARAAGQPRRAEILAAAGLLADAGDDSPLRIGVITFGGIGGDLPALRLPSRSGWMWIAPAALIDAAVRPRGKGGSGPAVLPREALARLDFRDIVASADLVVTKTGYGTFMDCARHGTPCLFLSRPDWPEAQDLETWITQAGLGRAVPAEALGAGTWLDGTDLQRRRPLEGLNGAQEAADILVDLLGD